MIYYEESPNHVEHNCKIKYFIINGFECELLLQLEKHLLRNKSDEIIQAIEEIGCLIGADNIVIGIKEKNTKVIESLQSSIEKLNSTIKLHLSRTYYLSEDDQVLIYEITGRTIPTGGIPLNLGIIISKIETVLNAYEAL